MKYLIPLLLLFTGCASTISKVNNAREDALAAAQSYVHGAYTELHKAPPQVEAGTRLVDAAHDVLGPSTRKLDLPALEAGNTKELDKLKAHDVKVATERSAAEKKLIEEGVLYEAEHHQSMLRRIFGWSIATLGIGGTIALCVLVPGALPIVLKILAMVVGWICRALPIIFHFLGSIESTVSTKIDEWRAAAKAKNPESK